MQLQVLHLCKLQISHLSYVLLEVFDDKFLELLLYILAFTDVLDFLFVVAQTNLRV